MNDIEPTPDTSEVAASTAAQVRKRHRRMLIFLIALAVLAVSAFLVINFIDTSDTPDVPELPTMDEDQFEEPDYDRNILEDPAYLVLDRSIYHTDGGVTVVMDATNRQSLGQAAMLLEEMIEYIIAGDADGYNSLFTETYRAENGTQAAFTMQQLYHIELEVGSSESVTEDDRTVHYQTYYVTYRIHENNGTFRRDIASEERRTQIITLCDREDGQLKINAIGYRGYVKATA